MNEKSPVIKWVLIYRTILIGILVGLLGIGLLWWTADQGRWANATSWQAFGQQLGSLFVVTGLLTLLWDLFSRRAFAQELLELTGLAACVRSAGVTKIASSFRAELEWGELLRDARALDVFVCWARTWRNQHETHLAAILERKGGLIRVVLPDYEHADTVAAMANHFADYDGDRVRQEIKDAVAFFKALHQSRKHKDARVEVYLVKRVPLFSWYLIDESAAVLAFYAHRAKVSSVPALVCQRGGYLYDFAAKEFEFLSVTTNEARAVSMEVD